MKIYNSKDKIEYNSPAMALGNFDGVHLGHIEVINNAKNIGESFGVLLFREHTETDIKEITSFDEKLRIFESFGVDYVYVVDFCDFKNMSLSEFCLFISSIGVKAVSVGYDYRCAKDASADAFDLSAELRIHGIKTHISQAVEMNSAVVKSTHIRDLIKCGDVDTARKLMTRPLRLKGRVIKGLQNGRKLGFPTANIEIDMRQLLPEDGVYCAICYVEEKDYTALVNIGKNPTFDATVRTVEAHIIDCDKELYGDVISVDIYKRIRGEIKFETMEELSEQINSDKKYVVSWRSELKCI